MSIHPVSLGSDSLVIDGISLEMLTGKEEQAELILKMECIVRACGLSKEQKKMGIANINAAIKALNDEQTRPDSLSLYKKIVRIFTGAFGTSSKQIKRLKHLRGIIASARIKKLQKQKKALKKYVNKINKMVFKKEDQLDLDRVEGTDKDYNKHIADLGNQAKEPQLKALCIELIALRKTIAANNVELNF